ncbi:MAG: hypothetical protein ACKOAU_19335 [Pirellula sp.]
MNTFYKSTADFQWISCLASNHRTLERIWVAMHLILLLWAPWMILSSNANRITKPIWQPPESYRFVSAPYEVVPDHSEPLKSTTANTTQVSQSPCGCSDSDGVSRQPILGVAKEAGLSDVWELSSRHLPEKFQCINPVEPGLLAHRYRSTGWQKGDLQDALVDDGRLVILYVHGNFMERNNALERVLILNQYLSQQAQRPYRLLMLSWPSTREPHPLRDVYENAESAECQALFVSWILERLARHQEVSLLGFSLGARAVTGGLHLDAGGSIPGFRYSSNSSLQGSGRRYRVALVAPAIDRDWLSHGGKHARSLDNVSGLVNLYNSKDPILRRFRFIDRISRPVAAGFAGFIGLPGLEDISNPRATQPLTGSQNIRQFDCGSGIGNTHSERSYYAQCPYFKLLIDHLLGQEADEQSIE